MITFKYVAIHLFELHLVMQIIIFFYILNSHTICQVKTNPTVQFISLFCVLEVQSK